MLRRPWCAAGNCIKCTAAVQARVRQRTQSWLHMHHQWVTPMHSLQRWTTCRQARQLRQSATRTVDARPPATLLVMLRSKNNGHVLQMRLLTLSRLDTVAAAMQEASMRPRVGKDGQTLWCAPAQLIQDSFNDGAAGYKHGLVFGLS